MTNFNNLPADFMRNLVLLGALNNLKNGITNNENLVNGHTKCNLNLEEHLKYADGLKKAGIIDEKTAELIKSGMREEFSGTKMPQDTLKTANVSDFIKARSCLLNYLNTHEIDLTERDLAEIETLVTELERGAIEREAKKRTELINSSNESAKTRLNCSALVNSGLNANPKKTFTREEIAKMSSAEFIKNEPMINYQLQNGLL